MSTPTPRETDLSLEDLAAMLERYALESGRKEAGEFATKAAPTYPPFDEALRRAALALRQHQRLKRRFNGLKILGAAAVTLFALATALVGQSAGWADHNLTVAYLLLYVGSAAAMVGGFFAVYLGMASSSGAPEEPDRPASP